jgi:tRNA pseudouridine55 synthase
MEATMQFHKSIPRPGLRLAGFLVLNKPSGPTSRAMVDQVVSLVRGHKVGHAGTLDPLATGVLVVCIGSATRLVELVQGLPKSYRATLQLGAESDTLDAEGPVTLLPSARIPTGTEITQAIPGFVGAVDQTPPLYSAVKLGGRRSHELARAGRPVQPAPRVVRIDRIGVVRYEWPELELEIDCGSGTYIRSIARDLGEALGCGAFLTALTRTRIGDFTIDQAVDPDRLCGGEIQAHLRPLLAAVPAHPRLEVTPEQLAALSQGRRLCAGELGRPALAGGEVALLDQAGALVALARYNPEEAWLQPTKVFQ